MALVFFITGVSSGFGLDIAIKALEQGHKVIGTLRNRQKAAENVSQIESKGGKVLQLDVTYVDACTKVWAEAEAIHGHIDILINNAGMSYLGALEDFTDEEIRAQMDVNVYGPMRLIRSALPGMRERNTGTIVNVTSVAGFDGLPCSGIYAASKFALEGLSEALSREVADYDIDVLIVEPGGFRTKFLGNFITNDKANLDHYAPAKAMLNKFATWDGQQPGDPKKAAQAIVEVCSGQGKAGHVKGKSLRLPLGPDCVERMEAKIQSMSKDLETVRSVAMSTNFDE